MINKIFLFVCLETHILSNLQHRKGAFQVFFSNANIGIFFHSTRIFCFFMISPSDTL
jgi:hypothetical protein